MKAFVILTFFLFTFLIPIKSNNIVNDYNFLETPIEEQENFGEIFKVIGKFEKGVADSVYIGLNIIVFRKEVNTQSQKSFKRYDEKLYGYNIVFTSDSEIEDQLTSTWLWGFWVKINGVNVTKALYPRGKDIMIYTTPTSAFYFEEIVGKEIKINVGWEIAVPDPKIIK